MPPRDVHPRISRIVSAAGLGLVLAASAAPAAQAQASEVGSAQSPLAGLRAAVSAVLGQEAPEAAAQAASVSGPSSSASALAYSLDAQGNATVTGPGGLAGQAEVDVPAAIDGHPVVAVGTGAFSGQTSLVKVTLPDSVTQIGDGAFSGCTSLSEVGLPSSLAYLGTSAFAGCASLQSVEIPAGLAACGTSWSGSTAEGPFAGCASLASARIADGATQVAHYLFAGCPSLATIEVPASVTSLSADSFDASEGYLSRLTVVGEPGSAAEQFARQNGAAFKSSSVPATSVSLDRSSAQLFRGASLRLAASVLPQDTTDALVWETTDASVASVAQDGTVTAVGAGQATVTARAGSVSASCAVTVTVPVSSITLNRASFEFEASETRALVADVAPADATDKRVAWSSSDPSVASVDQDGVVTAVGKGRATITCAALDGSGVTRSCAVEVVSDSHAVADLSAFQSAHEYPNGSLDFWTYTLPGAQALDVTFSQQTFVENTFDTIEVISGGGTGTVVGTYTGAQLAGATVRVPGDTVSVKLVSDDQTTGWGFQVTDVSEVVINGWVSDGKYTYYYENGTPLRGENYIDGDWYYFDISSARMVTGVTPLPDGRTCCYDGSGRRVEGDVLLQDGWHYFSLRNGDMYIGLCTMPDGTRRYYDHHGVRASGPVVIDGRTYYFNAYTGAQVIGPEYVDIDITNVTNVTVNNTTVNIDQIVVNVNDDNADAIDKADGTLSDQDQKDKEKEDAEKEQQAGEEGQEGDGGQAEQPAEQPAEEPEQPADQPAEEPEQPSDQPAEEPADQPAEQPEQPAEEPAEQPEQPAEQPAEQPSDQPAEEPAEQPAEQPADQPSEQPAEQPAEEPAEQPEQPVEEPSDQPAEQPEQPAEDEQAALEADRAAASAALQAVLDEGLYLSAATADYPQQGTLSWSSAAFDLDGDGVDELAVLCAGDGGDGFTDMQVWRYDKASAQAALVANLHGYGPQGQPVSASRRAVVWSQSQPTDASGDWSFMTLADDGASLVPALRLTLGEGGYTLYEGTSEEGRALSAEEAQAYLADAQALDWQPLGTTAAAGAAEEAAPVEPQQLAFEEPSAEVAAPAEAAQQPAEEAAPAEQPASVEAQPAEEAAAVDEAAPAEQPAEEAAQPAAEAEQPAEEAAQPAAEAEQPAEEAAPAEEQPAEEAEQPAEEAAPAEQPAEEAAPAGEQPAEEAAQPAAEAEQPAEEAAPAEEQPVEEAAPAEEQPAEEAAPAEEPAAEEAPVPVTDQASLYQAYYSKLLEYEAAYGAHGVEAVDGQGDRYTGLAVAKLVDFNGDGSEELLLAYLDPAGNGGAGAYATEVWGVRDAALACLLHLDGALVSDDGCQVVVLAGDGSVQYLLAGSDESGLAFYGFAADGTFGQTAFVAPGEDGSANADPLVAAFSNGTASQTWYFLDHADNELAYLDEADTQAIVDATLAVLQGDESARVQTAQLADGTEVEVGDQLVEAGDRAGRAALATIAAADTSWQVWGALCEDADGSVSVRFRATVDGGVSVVAWYGGAALFDCFTGYQVLPTGEEGVFATPTGLGVELAPWTVVWGGTYAEAQAEAARIAAEEQAQAEAAAAADQGQAEAAGVGEQQAEGQPAEEPADQGEGAETVDA